MAECFAEQPIENKPFSQSENKNSNHYRNVCFSSRSDHNWRLYECVRINVISVGFAEQSNSKTVCTSKRHKIWLLEQSGTQTVCK